MNGFRITLLAIVAIATAGIAECTYQEQTAVPSAVAGKGDTAQSSTVVEPTAESSSTGGSDLPEVAAGNSRPYWNCDVMSQLVRWVRDTVGKYGAGILQIQQGNRKPSPKSSTGDACGEGPESPGESHGSTAAVGRAGQEGGLRGEVTGQRVKATSTDP
eukprot:GHVS01062181.1.p1 GENE.GHVS01062181.1~~GHVS01062181.1.p1  ORF type:complete len:159 (+),score=25.54 GHVS01062181.1:568-1044(+)